MIPDYQTLMLPLLQIAQEGELSTRDAIEKLATTYELTDEERENLLPSGKQRTFDNRVNWAKSYLKQAGLIRYPSRGAFVITDAGRRVLAGNPARIDAAFLRQFPSFLEFQNRRTSPTAGQSATASTAIEDESATPDEIIRTTYERLNAALAADLLDRVRDATPQFFEELLIELLLAMGYGGSSEDAARAIGQSGDGGVDGVIDQDPLGIDQLYVQAKRYAEANAVGPGQIRDFFGALNIKKAQKGLFVTTSTFTASAVQTAKDLGMRIVLIDGQQLAKLMIRYNIGCRDEDVLHIKKVDEEFFG
ncbi:restriction endonuclease [Devosia honganensis]|uniref:Restriction endonuclease n=1 Tax=Devosia honganensis TaxID=1610527 RepID=A0ABV7X3Y5_9HYPH